MRKIFTKIAICAVLLLCAAAAGASEITKLSVTYVPSPLNLPSIVERAEGRFGAAFPGVEIALPELNAGPAQTAGMASGEVDIAHCIGATSVILAASEGLDIRIVGIYSRAPKAFMILTRDETIKTPADLKGKKIGGPKGTILHQLLAAAASKAGLAAGDYEFVGMDIPSAAAALSGGSIDAALLAGPAAYKATSDGARVVADGSGLVDATTVIATTQRYLDEHGDVIERFLKMHGETVASIESDKEKDFALAAEETGLSPEAVETMYGWYDFSPEIRESDVEELKRTQEFMLGAELQRNRIDIDEIVAKQK